MKQQGPIHEDIKSNGGNSIKPSRFKPIPEETPQFDEQIGGFSRNIRKPPLIPDNKDKPNLYR